MAQPTRLLCVFVARAVGGVVACRGVKSRAEARPAAVLDNVDLMDLW